MIRKQCFKYFPVLCLGLVLGACSSDEFADVEKKQQSKIEQETADTAKHTHSIQMKLVGDVDKFDKKAKLSKAASSTWANGDKIYITFYDGSTAINGDATYNTSTGWKVTYDGTLATGTALKSEVRFFENTVTVEPQMLTLNPASVIYEDIEATYDYDGSELVVKATLKPKTGRLRFKGAEGEKIYLTGLTHYTKFYWANNTYYTSSDDLPLTVGSDGYTPYVYVDFESSDRTICLVGNGYAFTRKKCSADILTPGASGNMTIPTDASHDGWLNGFYFGNYRLIPVLGHKDGFYLIGETEVHEVQKSNEPWVDKIQSSSVGSNYWYSTALKDYVSKISTNWTDLPFKVPTLSQWQYAAKGGNKSVGYTYSGSNDIDDVAWYGSSTLHSVKQKAPNELGLYDMSGNISELAYDEQNERYVYCGGDYKSPAAECLPSYYTSSLYTANYDNYYNNNIGYGLRLVLKPNF